jgi:membrane-bound metal-dependent hydrolase YbcI (DUF457 family)
MRTYTHGAIGYLLYARRPRGERRLAAAGAVLPDVILAVGFIFHVAQPWTRVSLVADLHTLFHHSALHTVTIALHSFVLVVPLLGLAYVFYRRAMPLVVGMLSHGVVDLLTHRGSAYNHLFPLPLPPVRGPFNYTDPVFTVIEHIALIATLLWLAERRLRRAGRRAHDVSASGVGPR